MSHRVLLVALLVAFAVSLSVLAVEAQGPRPGGRKSPATLAGTAFTFQGQLKKNGALVNGTCDIDLGMWDSDVGGTQLGITKTVTNIVIANGLLMGPVNDGGSFGPNAFNGELHALQFAVRCPAGSGSYTALSPRLVLNAAPLAFALPGLYTQQNATSPNIIGGFNGNTISPTVVGGTISGGGANGSINSVSGSYATVPGGASNLAQGDYSFSAGRRARALNQGSFVWSDSTNADFASTGNDQFLIRAAGGVGINTTNPTANLEVAGGNLKVSNSGSGIIFPDASKQTTAASKVLGYDHVSPTIVVTTTEKVVQTITVTTGTSVFYQYGAQAAVAGCQLTGVTEFDLRLYLDGTMIDSTYTQVNPSDPGGFGQNVCVGLYTTLSQFGLTSLTPITHTFQIRAIANKTEPDVGVFDSRIVIINQ